MVKKAIRLKRPQNEMPSFVMQILEEHGLTDTYKEQPAYQQNDYIEWINTAKRSGTKEKRL
jgi:uncharacterized protein YdeI (YjbR/CyaY-like superfamily)